MTRASLPVILAVVVLAAMAPIAVLAERPTSERGIATPGAVLARPSSGPIAHGADGAKVYYSDSNSSNPATPFYEYDVASDAWSTKAPLPSLNTTQLASDENGVVYSLPEDGRIYVYDPPSNSWTFVMDGPAAAIGRNAISLFEAHGGEFYWAKDATTTLYYTVGGVWNSITTPRLASCAAAIDRATGILYVRTYTALGFFAFDPSDLSFPQICDHGDGLVTENGRAGAYFNGEFYSREFSGNYIATDVATCAVRDTGTAPTSTHSSTGEDLAGNIYSNGWNDDTVFENYDAVADILTPLAAAPDIPDNAHSTLVAVTPEGCLLDLALRETRLRAGDPLVFTVGVHHRRPATVTVHLRAWVENAQGIEIATFDLGTLNLRYRDHRTLERSLELPPRMPAGHYSLLVAIASMRQGTLTVEKRFQVLDRPTPVVR